MKRELFAFVLVSLLIISLTTLKAQTLTLTKIWETEATLKVPESVIYNPLDKSLYVANINGNPWDKDGNGFISKISLHGKIEVLEWVKGLDAPKGMGIFKNKLYVADVNKIVVIDIHKAVIEKTIEVPESKLLNDITVSNTGDIYISDSGNQRVFILKGDKAEVWLQSDQIEKPNGLLALPHHLLIADMNTGTLLKADYSSKVLEKISEGIPACDGIIALSNHEYLISGWSGEVSLVKDNTVHKLLDTKESKVNAADIWYIPAEKLLLVPTFFANTVVAYSVKK